jgi:hypothetical protein
MGLNETINALIITLFEPENRRLKGMINELNTSNKRLKTTKVDGFLYGGKLYLPTGVPTMVFAAGQSKHTLDFSLNGEMERWLKDSKVINDDASMIKQTLWKLLKPCQTDIHVRNALPECLVTLIPGLKVHPRTSEAGYTILEDTRAWRQFQKYLPKMELYSITRLLY